MSTDLPGKGNGNGSGDDNGAAGEPTASLITYPSDFPIKVMGAMQDGFAEAIVTLVQGFDSGFHAGKMEMRPSRNGNYLGLTITVWVTSREQLDDIYRALTSHPMVKVVL